MINAMWRVFYTMKTKPQPPSTAGRCLSLFGTRRSNLIGAPQSVQAILLILSMFLALNSWAGLGWRYWRAKVNTRTREIGKCVCVCVFTVFTVAAASLFPTEWAQLIDRSLGRAGAGEHYTGNIALPAVQQVLRKQSVDGKTDRNIFCKISGKVIINLRRM